MMPDRLSSDPFDDQELRSHFGVPEVDVDSQEFHEALDSGYISGKKGAISVTKMERGTLTPAVTSESLELITKFVYEKFDQAERQFDSGLDSVRDIITWAASSKPEDDIQMGNVKSTALEWQRSIEDLPVNMISEEVANTMHITKLNLSVYVELLDEMQSLKSSLPEETYIFQRGSIVAGKYGKRLYAARATLESSYRLLQKQQQTVKKSLASIASELQG